MFRSARHSRRLPAVLLGFCFSLMLGMQALEAGHFHAGGIEPPECVLCHLDCGQALVQFQSAAVPALLATDKNHPDVAAAPVSTYYRLAARGPPVLSS